MSLVSLLVTLVVVGLILWVVQQLPIDATIKRIIHVVLVVVVVLWLIQTFLGVGLGIG